MPVRLKDIARDLGLSPMAVSKALRGHTDIAEETRRRVLRRATEVNYRVDWVARGLRAGQTFLVGLVVPDLMQSFFSEIAAAVSQTLARHGYHIIISYTGEDSREEIANLELLEGRKVDGLIIASAQRDGRFLRRLATPHVLVDRALSGVAAPFVGSDNEEVGRTATEHLIAQGCRRIAHLVGPEVSSAAGRLAGFRRTLRRHRLTTGERLVVRAGHDDSGGYRAMRHLLTTSSRPDGVFCFNDPVAVGAMRAILDAGLAIPEDIALIGVANMHYSDMLAIPLSTIDQDIAVIGHSAADLLLSCIAGKAKKKVGPTLVAPRLVVRASSLRRSG